jgi:hypothetical protein
MGLRFQVLCQVIFSSEAFPALQEGTNVPVLLIVDGSFMASKIGVSFETFWTIWKCTLERNIVLVNVGSG